MNNDYIPLPKITPKKFDGDKFTKIAKEVAKIIKEERKKSLEDQLERINDNYYSRDFLY